jgi:signal transduction histidine kinase
MRRLRDDARALQAEGLAHPVAVDDVRDEVREVASAMEGMRLRLLREETGRQEFLQVASHELRTPLATLQANLELLAEEADGDTRRRAEGALRQTHRLVTLASDLLDLGRLDGGVRPPLQAVELGELVVRLRDELGVPFAIRAPGPVHALADSSTVLRILGILVDNARVHGQGAITVSLATEGDTALVAVCDEGPGLPAEDRERLFERFVRGSEAQGRPGSGLGLAIARGFAEAMDGQLCAPGGARLELRLPAWRDYPAATGAGDMRPDAPSLLGTSQAASTESNPTSTAAPNAAV